DLREPGAHGAQQPGGGWHRGAPVTRHGGHRGGEDRAAPCDRVLPRAPVAAHRRKPARAVTWNTPRAPSALPPEGGRHLGPAEPDPRCLWMLRAVRVGGGFDRLSPNGGGRLSRRSH